jgi:5-methylcytosine-specific restriction endonuclease McrA
MANKPCLKCGQPTTQTRCRACAPQQPSRHKRGLDRTHDRLRRTLIDTWVAQHGWWCPGYQRDAHAVEPGRLSLDHIVPRSVAPHLMHEPSNLTILCLPCNQKKGAKT